FRCPSYRLELRRLDRVGGRPDSREILLEHVALSTIWVRSARFVHGSPSDNDHPASTASSAPVMSLAAGSHRERIASATSSALPAPCASGCLRSRYRRVAPSASALAAIGVSISPGATRLNRMPFSA